MSYIEYVAGHRSGICCVLGINWKPLYDCMTYTYNIWVLWNIKLFFSGDTGLFLATSHYLNQCWNIVDWNKLQWNFNRNSYKRIHLKMSSGKQWPFCLGFSMLTLALLMLDTGRITLCENNGRHFENGIFRCIFLNENVSILIGISLKYVTWVRITFIWTNDDLVYWHICVTRPPWFHS